MCEVSLVDCDLNNNYKEEGISVRVCVCESARGEESLVGLRCVTKRLVPAAFYDRRRTVGRFGKLTNDWRFYADALHYRRIHRGVGL